MPDLEPASALATVPSPTAQPFTDCMRPLSQRPGFAPGRLPVYAVRVIGLLPDPTDWHNQLFRLSQRLQALGPAALRLEEGLPVEVLENLQKRTEDLWERYANKPPASHEKFVNHLLSRFLLPELGHPALEETLLRATRFTLARFLEGERGFSVTQVRNVALKLLSWCHRFLPPLLEGLAKGLPRTSPTGSGRSSLPPPAKESGRDTAELHPGKILFYGRIRRHEALFLLLAARAGCDVLYVNTAQDGPFGGLEQGEPFFQLLMLDNLAPLPPFPTAERQEEVETVGFRTARELSAVLAGSDGYRPWELERHQTRPVTLRSSWEELPRLWLEEARDRPGFRVEGDTVSLPNLFLKVSGVTADLVDYKQRVIQLKSAPGTVFWDSLPLPRATPSAGDAYALGPLFDRDKRLDPEKVRSSPLYAYQHLREPLQVQLIAKANVLLRQPLLKGNLSMEQRKQVAFTALRLDRSLLQALQGFDYPASLPRLILFHHGESVARLEDVQVLVLAWLLGFDVLILTPTGYQDVELHLQDAPLETLRLEKVALELRPEELSRGLPPPAGGQRGLLARLLGRGRR